MHWTYSTFQVADDLEQGDIIMPTQDLRDVLQQVHPHFCDEKYLAFVIATQSCDLVRRKAGVPKARHISIAVIRSLKAVMPQVLGDVVQPVARGIFRSGEKKEARRFLERLFDQNEQSLGLFYFHPDGEVGIGDPAVAFLRITVALRAEHYDVLLRARRGRLDAEFRAKFGWLLGNLYSRAASPDWADHEGGKKTIDGLVDTCLSEQIPGSGPTWIDDELVDAGKSASVVFENRKSEELIAELTTHQPKPQIDRIVDEVTTIAEKIFQLDADKSRVFRNKLLNSGTIRKHLKR